MEGHIEEATSTAALRAEVEEEIRNKKQCSYQSYECTQLSLDGYKFCSKHILQDKNAPYKQCSYVFSSNGKRCHLPAPRSDKKDYGYCNEHALRATLIRNKQNSKNPPPRSAEVLLHSISHYIKKPKTQAPTTSFSEDYHISDESTELRMTKYNDPFVDLDATTLYNDKCSEVLDFGSESDSDIEPSTLSSVWNDAHADSSGDESIDSEHEDPLKHANVYTAEEVSLIIRDKLIRLQSLYVEQYRHLQYLLKEKRRKYLHALKREKETCCNIYNQVRDNPKEQRLYKKLKALNNYQRCHGVEAILNKRLKDLRSKNSDANLIKSHPSIKCIFTEGGVKCGERTLPITKYCKKHILEDQNQILFRACGKINDNDECTTPIAAMFDDSTCQLHMDIPPLKSYNQMRKDSESDMDESGDATNIPNFPTDNFTENMKHEFVPYDIPPELPKMETLPSLLFEENSQSLSESTISQNELFNLSDRTLNAEVGFNLKEEREEIQNCGGFYQISESCSLVPNKSGTITINKSPSKESLNKSPTKQSLPWKIPANSSLSGLMKDARTETPTTILKEGNNCDLNVNEANEKDRESPLNSSDDFSELRISPHNENEPFYTGTDMETDTPTCENEEIVKQYGNINIGSKNESSLCDMEAASDITCKPTQDSSSGILQSTDAKE